MPSPVHSQIAARPQSAACETLGRTDPDTDVIDRMSSGDLRGALHALVERHGAAVYRYCRRMLRDTALAQDVHQQVFEQVLRDLPTFAGRSTLRSWLLAIARHRVLDAAIARRRRWALSCNAPVAESIDPKQPAGELLDDARLEAALVASVGELSDPIRTAILMRYQHGLSFEEMAVLCGEKSGTIQTRVARALPVLRASILQRTRRRPIGRSPATDNPVPGKCATSG